MKFMHQIIATTLGLLVVGAIADGALNSTLLSQQAEAIMGRPATPASVAGVARRTSRRVVRRSSIYVASLPTSCSTVIVEGTSLYYCDNTYYERYNDQYVVVYVD